MKGNLLDTRSAIYPASLFPSLAVVAGRRGRRGVGRQPLRHRSRMDRPPRRRGHRVRTTGKFSRRCAAPHGDWGAPVNASNDPAAADRHPSIAFAGTGEARRRVGHEGVERVGRQRVAAVEPDIGGDGVAWTPSAPLALDPAAMSQRPARRQWSRLVGQRGLVRLAWHRLALVGVGSDDRATSARDPATASRAPGNANFPSISGNLVAFTSTATQLAYSATRPKGFWSRRSDELGEQTHLEVGLFTQFVLWRRGWDLNHGEVAPTTVFETVRFGRSRTPPG